MSYLIGLSFSNQTPLIREVKSFQNRYAKNTTKIDFLKLIPEFNLNFYSHSVLKDVFEDLREQLESHADSITNTSITIDGIAFDNKNCGTLSLNQSYHDGLHYLQESLIECLYDVGATFKFKKEEISNYQAHIPLLQNLNREFKANLIQEAKGIFDTSFALRPIKVILYTYKNDNLKVVKELYEFQNHFEKFSYPLGAS